jgi:hypothetical protein
VNFFGIEEILIQINGCSENVKSACLSGKDVIRKGDGNIDGRTE